MKIINFIRYRIRKFLMEEITLEDHIKRGMKVGDNCALMDGSVYDYGHCNLITIGNNVTIAPHAYLLAHDASTKRDLGYTKIGQIVIKDNVFIGARSLIMPGVTIGENSIVAAGSVITQDVLPNTVVAGNPAKVIMSKDEYISKNESLLKKYPKFSWDYSHASGNLTEEMKQEMRERLKGTKGYMI